MSPVVSAGVVAGAFTADDPAFTEVTGPRPQLVKVVGVAAHEGPVYVLDEDALYFTTLPRSRDEAGFAVPLVDICRLSLDGTRYPVPVERVSVLRPQANAANGMTLAQDGSLLVCEQGSWFQPARISRVDRATGVATTVVDRWGSARLSSPNDVVVHPDGSIWFTDPSYGYLQGFRPRPALPDAVYRFDPTTGGLGVVDASFDKPNGLAFSPDHSVLYVTDSGANHEPGTLDLRRPHEVVALDLSDDGRVRSRRLVTRVEPGFPDGIKTDAAGRIFVSSFSGVQVFTPEGARLGQIELPGAVNFAFGGPAGNVLYITTDTAVWAAVLDTKGS